jgi:hypothetical protein
VFDVLCAGLLMVTGSRSSLVVSGGSESFCVLRVVISAIRDQAKDRCATPQKKRTNMALVIDSARPVDLPRRVNTPHELIVPPR